MLIVVAVIVVIIIVMPRTTKYTYSRYSSDALQHTEIMCKYANKAQTLMLKYICIHMCMHVYMYVHTYTHKYIHTCTHMQTYTHRRIHTYALIIIFNFIDKYRLKR